MIQRLLTGFFVLTVSITVASCSISRKHPADRVQAVNGHDNGLHKGWYKNPNNPHHPNHSKAKGQRTSNGTKQESSKKQGKGKKS
ncbi:hypothetical protein [Pontibacter chitinilyticus]|uniref:hypothetical protein n=1 Tax=Pontibacter chitinilyticus TaxID=2674989 RepID=UPI00321A6FFC